MHDRECSRRGSGSAGRALRVRGRKAARWVALIVTTIGTSGCYGYFAARPATLHPGEQVRVVLDNGVAEHFSPEAAVNDQELDGTFLGLSHDSLKLSVWIGRDYQGTGFGNARRTIAIPEASVHGIKQRRLSKVRTGLAAAAVVVAVAVVIAKVHFIGAQKSGGTTTPPPPSNPAIRIPLAALLHAISW